MLLTINKMIATLRKYKIFGLAIFDIVSSIIGLVLIFLVAKRIHFRELPATPFVIAGVLLAIPVGIVFHILFGTNTQLNYHLGLSNDPKTS